MPTESKRIGLRAAINAKCVDCCCGQKAEVRRCQITACSLWSVRPYQSKEQTGPKKPQPAWLRRDAAKAMEAK